MAQHKVTPSFSGEDFLQALDRHDYNFQVGQIVKGKVFQVDSRGVYADIGGKSPGFLPMEEIVIGMEDVFEEVFAIGSEHEFLIIRDQDEEGEVRLSIRRLFAKKAWLNVQELKNKNRVFQVRVTGVNRGGVVVDAGGIQGFIPRSQLLERDTLEKLVGQSLPVVVMEVEEERKRLILSHRSAVRVSAFSQLGVGQLVAGTVTGLRPFGVFVDLGGIGALLHNKEISEKNVSDPSRLFKVGDSLRAVVIEVDESRQRVALSTKILELHPGEMLERPDQIFAEAESRLEKNVSKLWEQPN